MIEILNFWLSVSISQMAAYLMFILLSNSTYPVSLFTKCTMLLHIRSTNRKSRSNFLFDHYLTHVVII